MSAVLLTGMMGTGKTEVARALGAMYGLSVVDTDEEIERRAGCTIAEYWAAHEEPAFRDLEADVFRDVLADRAGTRVIACGAGTLVAERNRALLGPDTRVYCLTCELEELVTRLERQDRATRPLLSGGNDEDLAPTLARRLEQRRPVYEIYEAIDTTGRCAEAVAREIARRAGLAEVGCLTVDRRRESELLFGRGLLRELGSALAARSLGSRKHVRGGQVVVISDRGAREAGWVHLALSSLDAAGFRVVDLPLEGGEADKNMSKVEGVALECAAAHLDRDAVILGIGGGALCDLAGFVAATYLRGIELVLAPTTLLAQVDAAIGGKVGVDLPGFKNAIGAFYPARIIAIDPDALGSLPPTLLSDGLAEVVKSGFMLSPELLARVEVLSGRDAILDRPDIIRSTGAEKLRLAQVDPYERGDRALLNFGHTVGHAVESASEFRLSHGQAVSIGMAAETWLAEREGWCPPGTLPRLTSLLRRLDLPISTTGDPDRIVPLMYYDKKRRGGRLRFAVPAEPGRGIIVEVTPQQARAAVEQALKGSQE